MTNYCYNCFDILSSNNSWYYAHDHSFCSGKCRYLFALKLDREDKDPSTNLVSVKAEKQSNVMESISPVIYTHNHCFSTNLSSVKIEEQKNIQNVSYIDRRPKKCPSMVTLISSLVKLTSFDKFLGSGIKVS